MPEESKLPKQVHFSKKVKQLFQIDVVGNKQEYYNIDLNI